MWDTKQDGEGNSRHIYEGILIFTGHRLGHEEDNSRQEKRIRWNFTTVAVLEDLDFADDIALLSPKFNDLREKTERLMEEAARVGLKIDAKKCKTLRTEQARSQERIVVNDEQVEDVEEFVYLEAS